MFPKHRILNSNSNSNWQSQIPNTNQTCLDFQIFLTFFCLLDFVCINLWTPQRLSCLISYSKHVYRSSLSYHEKLSSQESNLNIYRPRSVHCFQNYFRLSITFILFNSFIFRDQTSIIPLTFESMEEILKNKCGRSTERLSAVLNEGAVCFYNIFQFRKRNLVILFEFQPWPFSYSL